MTPGAPIHSIGGPEEAAGAEEEARLVRLPVSVDAAEDEIRLCLIDDQPLFREALGRMLASRPGLSVVGEAGDGESAVRMVLSLKPDVILMDIGLPRLDGLEATRRIRQALPGVRVIVVTAYPSDELFRQAMALGVDSFVLKDARLDDLVATIRLTHQGHRLLNGALLETYVTDRRPQLPYGLTRRELQLLSALAEGEPNRGIAARFRITEKTVRNHLSNIYAKLSVSGRSQAVIFAIQNGLAKVDTPGQEAYPRAEPR